MAASSRPAPASPYKYEAFVSGAALSDRSIAGSTPAAPHVSAEQAPEQQGQANQRLPAQACGASGDTGTQVSDGADSTPRTRIKSRANTLQQLGPDGPPSGPTPCAPVDRHQPTTSHPAPQHPPVLLQSKATKPGPDALSTHSPAQQDKAAAAPGAALTTRVSYARLFACQEGGVLRVFVDHPVFRPSGGSATAGLALPGAHCGPSPGMHTPTDPTLGVYTYGDAVDGVDLQARSSVLCQAALAAPVLMWQGGLSRELQAELPDSSGPLPAFCLPYVLRHGLAEPAICLEPGGRERLLEALEARHLGARPRPRHHAADPRGRGNAPGGRVRQGVEQGPVEQGSGSGGEALAPVVYIGNDWPCALLPLWLGAYRDVAASAAHWKELMRARLQLSNERFELGRPGVGATAHEEAQGAELVVGETKGPLAAVPSASDGTAGAPLLRGAARAAAYDGGAANESSDVRPWRARAVQAGGDGGAAVGATEASAGLTASAVGAPAAGAVEPGAMAPWARSLKANGVVRVEGAAKRGSQVEPAQTSLPMQVDAAGVTGDAGAVCIPAQRRDRDQHGSTMDQTLSIPEDQPSDSSRRQLPLSSPPGQPHCPQAAPQGMDEGDAEASGGPASPQAVRAGGGAGGEAGQFGGDPAVQLLAAEAALQGRLLMRLAAVLEGPEAAGADLGAEAVRSSAAAAAAQGAPAALDAIAARTMPDAAGAESIALPTALDLTASRTGPASAVPDGRPRSELEASSAVTQPSGALGPLQAPPASAGEASAGGTSMKDPEILPPPPPQQQQPQQASEAAQPVPAAEDAAAEPQAQQAHMRRTLQAFRSFVAGRLRGARVVFAVHNLAFAGVVAERTLAGLGLPTQALQHMLLGGSRKAQGADGEEGMAREVNKEEGSSGGDGGEPLESGRGRTLSAPPPGDACVEPEPGTACGADPGALGGGGVPPLALDTAASDASAAIAAQSPDAAPLPYSQREAGAAAGGVARPAGGAPPALASPRPDTQTAAPDGGPTEAEACWLRAALLASDLLVTVSPSYAAELVGSSADTGGGGWDGLKPAQSLLSAGSASPVATLPPGFPANSEVARELRALLAARGVAGVLNGLDVAAWDPATDPLLPPRLRYGAADVAAGKARAKAELQAALGLEPDPRIALVAFVGRLTDQKGADVVLAALPALLGPPAVGAVGSAYLATGRAGVAEERVAGEAQAGAGASAAQAKAPPKRRRWRLPTALARLLRLPLGPKEDPPLARAPADDDAATVTGSAPAIPTATLAPVPAPAAASMRLQVTMLGSGDAWLQDALRRLPAAYPGCAAAAVGHDEALAHLLLAGADFLVVPSRWEPCGLVALAALRYGTVPVVAPTGGLLDVVTPGEERRRGRPTSARRGGAGAGDARSGAAGGSGTQRDAGAPGRQDVVEEAEGAEQGGGSLLGLVMDQPVGPAGDSLALREAATSLVRAVVAGVELHGRPAELEALRARCMAADVSWARPAEEWERLLLQVAAGQGGNAEREGAVVGEGL